MLSSISKIKYGTPLNFTTFLITCFYGKGQYKTSSFHFRPIILRTILPTCLSSDWSKNAPKYRLAKTIKGIHKKPPPCDQYNYNSILERKILKFTL